MRARKDLVRREKKLSRMAQDVARAMREMPVMKISKDYVFTRPDGRNVCLPNLFEGKRQLVVYQYAAFITFRDDAGAFADRAGLQMPFYASTSLEFGRDMHAMMTRRDCAATHGHHHHRHHQLKAKGPMGKGARLYKSIMDDLMDDLLDGARGEDEDVGEGEKACGGHGETGEDEAGVSIFCEGADGAVYRRYSYSAHMASTLGLLEVAPMEEVDV
ncbi:hypothetical protein RB598_000034 [Gaeumannomyces tritici]